MIDLTKILSKFVCEFNFTKLNDITIKNTRLFLIDYFAASMAGKKVNLAFNKAIESYIFSQGGAEESTSLFNQRKIPCGKAAFLNACYAHGADMDDGSRKAMGHVGAHVFSAVLALGEKLGAGEQDIIVAANVGYEVYCRVAAAAQPGLVHRGFHSTGTAGVIASAAAAAKLLGLNEEGVYNAMAISVTMASGLMIVAESGQSIKPLNPAKAAECGILAASLAQSGIKGGSNPLGSKKGWFHAMSDEIDESTITDGLGERFCINECYIKPYPSCRHTHCGMQAALELREEHAISVESIKAVNIYIYSNAIKIAGQIIRPQTIDDSKFSIHYATACILALGKFTLAELDYNNISHDVFEIIDKISLIADESMENRTEGIRGCRIEVVLTSGKTVDKSVLIPKGDPQNPFSFDDMRGKLAQCAQEIMTENEQKSFFERFMSFGKTNKEYKGISIL